MNTEYGRSPPTRGWHKIICHSHEDENRLLLENYRVRVLLIFIIFIQSVPSWNLRRYVVIGFLRKVFLLKDQLVVNIPKIPDADFWNRDDISGSVNIYVRQTDEQFDIDMEMHSTNSVIYRFQADSESSAELARAKALQMKKDILMERPEMKVVLIWNHGKFPIEAHLVWAFSYFQWNLLWHSVEKRYHISFRSYELDILFTPINMYPSIILSLLERGLDQALHLVQIAKNTNNNNLLWARLAPDMFPFTRQVQILSDNAKGVVARMYDVEIPSYSDEETTFDELIERLEKTKRFIALASEWKSAKAIDTIEATFPWNVWKSLTGQEYVLHLVIPNFYFHLVTLYNILRNNGVELGKQDFLGQLDWQEVK